MITPSVGNKGKIRQTGFYYLSIYYRDLKTQSDKAIKTTEAPKRAAWKHFLSLIIRTQLLQREQHSFSRRDSR